jgi:uncharacterized protein YukE
MKQIEELLLKLESILESDDFNYERDDDMLQDLHNQIEGRFSHEWEHASTDEYFRELDRLNAKFESLNKKWETPEEQRNSIMNMMFPDEDSMEGFDMDDFFGLN